MQCEIQPLMHIQLLKITVNQIQLLCFTQITQLHERKIILLRRIADDAQHAGDGQQIILPVFMLTLTGYFLQPAIVIIHQLCIQKGQCVIVHLIQQLLQKIQQNRPLVECLSLDAVSVFQIDAQLQTIGFQLLLHILQITEHGIAAAF